MATIISHLNSAAGIGMMGWKRHSAFPSRQVTPINFTSSFKFINYNNSYKYQFCLTSTCSSHPIASTLPSTKLFYSSSTTGSCSLQENYCNNDDHHVAAENITMMKPAIFANVVDIKRSVLCLFRQTDKSVGLYSVSSSAASRNFFDILASLLRYGVIFTFVTLAALLYTSNSALATSYGRMGGSSSSSSHGSSSSSFSYGQSSNPYYWSTSYRECDSSECDSSECDSSVTPACTCDTSCTLCINCNIRENSYKEDIEEQEDENSCSCNCHSACYHHQKVDHLSAYMLLAGIILYVILQLWMKMVEIDSEYCKGTMFIFQAGVLDKTRMLQRNLNNIAENADTSTLNGLNCVLKEVVTALQHDNSSLNYCYLSVQFKSMESLSKSFQENLNMLLQGYGKDNNTLGNVDGVIYKKQTEMAKASSWVDNEYTMTTIMVLATGQHTISTKKEKGKTYADTLQVLKALQRIPKNNIQSVEVLWSPQKEDEVLSEEAIRRYTTMTRVENGRMYLISFKP